MNTSEIIVSSASNSDESLHSYNDEEYDCEVDQENTSSSVSSSDCSSVGDTEDTIRVVYYKPDQTRITYEGFCACIEPSLVEFNQYTMRKCYNDCVENNMCDFNIDIISNNASTHVRSMQLYELTLKKY